jgi:hypothetical protein
MGRGATWSKGEDIQLVKSYLETSEDPEKGTNQSSKTLWENISTHYKEHLGGENTEPRTEDSLKGRWCDISRDCASFNEYYQYFEAHPRSGWNTEDVLKAAKEKFTEVRRKAHDQAEKNGKKVVLVR